MIFMLPLTRTGLEVRGEGREREEKPQVLENPVNVLINR